MLLIVGGQKTTSLSIFLSLALAVFLAAFYLPLTLSLVWLSPFISFCCSTTAQVTLPIAQSCLPPSITLYELPGVFRSLSLNGGLACRNYSRLILPSALCYASVFLSVDFPLSLHSTLFGLIFHIVSWQFITIRTLVPLLILQRRY